MRIYVPSRDRWLKGSTTLAQIPAARRGAVSYVVPREQEREYRKAGFPAISPPASVNRIAPTRQWIIEHHWKHYPNQPKLVMLDDDLTFYRRTETNIVQSTEHDRQRMFVVLEKTLDAYAHASIAMRLGANRFESLAPVLNTRMARVLGLRVDVLKKHKKKWFGEVAVQDDFHLILQLLTLGYSNSVITEYVQEQKSSNAPGGASVYRDMSFQADSVKTLAALWPDYVRVVEKKTKVSWGGQDRLDVVCSWKKAFEYGAEKHGPRLL